MRLLRPLPAAFVASTLLALLATACSSASSGGGSSHTDPRPADPQEASCGVGPVLDQDGGAAVNDAGVVTFDAIPAGTSATFAVAVKDSADVSETLLGATISGANADAFVVMSSFPVDVPAGQSVLVQVLFAPPASGTFTAQLVLMTEKMGPSYVQLQGTGQ
jgi:hypothetical protein